MKTLHIHICEYIYIEKDEFSLAREQEKRIQCASRIELHNRWFTLLQHEVA